MRNRKWERLKSWSMYILLLSLTEKLRDININRDRLDLAKQKVEGHLKSVSDKVAGSEEEKRGVRKRLERASSTTSALLLPSHFPPMCA